MTSNSLLKDPYYYYTYLSIRTQAQTIKYDTSVPIDDISTSCSRLNMADNTPENYLIPLPTSKKMKMFYKLNSYRQNLHKLS